MTGVMVVTGGSRGIGAAIARLAGRQGYAVCVNYRRHQDAAAEVVQSIEDSGGKALAVGADMAEEADVKRLFRIVDQDLGPLTALVNNAGIVSAKGRVDEMTAERINAIFALNVTGYFLCAREAVLRMSTKHGGSGGGIVNISSAAARLGGAGDYVDYAATKGAIDTLTVGLSREVAEEGIRVNGVRPGVIETDIHADTGQDLDERLEAFRTVIPMRRIGQPEEVAEAVLWLLSDSASYVTGTTLDVTGGR